MFVPTQQRRSHHPQVRLRVASPAIENVTHGKTDRRIVGICIRLEQQVTPKSPKLDRNLFGQGQLERADRFHVCNHSGAMVLPSVRVFSGNHGLNRPKTMPKGIQLDRVHPFHSCRPVD